MKAEGVRGAEGRKSGWALGTPTHWPFFRKTVTTWEALVLFFLPVAVSLTSTRSDRPRGPGFYWGYTCEGRAALGEILGDVPPPRLARSPLTVDGHLQGLAEPHVPRGPPWLGPMAVALLRASSQDRGGALPVVLLGGGKQREAGRSEPLLPSPPEAGDRQPLRRPCRLLWLYAAGTRQGRGDPLRTCPSPSLAV